MTFAEPTQVANGHACVIIFKLAEKYIRSNPHRSSGRLSKFVGPSEKWGRPKRNVRMQEEGGGSSHQVGKVEVGEIL